MDPNGNEVAEDADLGDEEYDALTQRRVFVTVHGCADFAEHGHTDRYGCHTGHAGAMSSTQAEKSDAEREAEKVARRLVIESNKASDSAQTVRREWVTTFLTRKTPPAGTAEFIAAALTRDADLIHDVNGNHLAAKWFGCEPPTHGRSPHLADLAEQANAKRAQVIALGVILAGYESRIDRSTWRREGTDAAHGRYLRFLASQGYTLAEVEDYAISNKTA